MLSGIKRAAATFALAAVLALCAGPAMAFAAGGNGTGGGNGSGGGSTSTASGPTLTTSNPEEGATIEAGTLPEMWLQFSNNVAESTVSADNIQKVHLQKADGTEVQATVSVKDTSTDSEHRQYIYITPAAALEADTSYVIVADAGITAKNGSSSTETYKVTFKTSAAASASASSSTNASADTTSAATTSSSNSNMGLIVGIAVVVIVIAVVAGVVIARRKKK